jgi:O-antigen/teichoic acid export membrane protein
MAVDPAAAGSGARRWLRQIALVAAVAALVAIPLRSPLAALLNVDEVWAAAALPLTSVLWAFVSVERGALQGFQRYRMVGASLVIEATFRVAFAVPLVVAGLGVTGAFLGSGLSLVAVGLVLAVPLFRRLPPASSEQYVPLRALLAGSWIPVVGLTLLFALQEVHVIVVKHEAPSAAAGSYAAAAVAAKAIIWVAVGLGMYLLPEATRRAKLGVNARPVLLRTLMLVVAASVPMVLFYAVAARPLLETAFGDELSAASAALPWLSLAMALLACAYLAVQYLLALGRATFIWLLAAGAGAEVLLLARVAPDLTGAALALLALQVVCATGPLALSLRQVRASEGDRVRVRV